MHEDVDVEEDINFDLIIFKIIRLAIIGIVIIILGFSGCEMHRNAQIATAIAHGAGPIAVGKAFPKF